MTSPSPSDPPPPEPWGWTRPQRVGLASLLFLLLVLLTLQYLRRPARLDDHTVLLRGHPLTLPSPVDPNTASADELARIPHLGDKLAARILDYRNARKQLTPDNVVFHSPQDLTHIPGLGGKTLEQLQPYLQFPDDADTQPATEYPLPVR